MGEIGHQGTGEQAKVVKWTSIRANLSNKPVEGLKSGRELSCLKLGSHAKLVGQILSDDLQLTDVPDRVRHFGQLLRQPIHHRQVVGNETFGCRQ